MTESRLGLVMIHGIMSGPRVWDPLRTLISADRELEFVEPLAFEYATGLWLAHPLRVFPSIDTVADSLKEYLATEAGAFDQLLLVTHSQGGLVAQRYLARMLQDGRGGELARIHRIVMIACPSNGSELMLSLRRRAFGLRHPQEKDLRPLNDQVSTTLRTVLRDVVHATSITERTCPIPVSVYAGESDRVVSRSSAQSVFPDSSALPGDHSSILATDSPRHRTFTALRRLILAAHNEVHASDPTPPSPSSSPPAPPAPSGTAGAPHGGKAEPLPKSIALRTSTPGPEPATEPAAPAPAMGKPVRKQRRPLITFTVIAALAVAASVLRFAPMPWTPGTGSPAADAKPSASGTGAIAPDPARKETRAIPPRMFPTTTRFWMVDINGNGMAEYVAVDMNQRFRFWWNDGIKNSLLPEFDHQGANSYNPEAGSDGAALRLGDIDGDIKDTGGGPDCMVVDRTGGVTVYTWDGKADPGERMCKKKYDGVADVPLGDSAGGSMDIKQIQFADIDRDGLDDYLRVEPDGRVTVWHNKGFTAKDGRKYLDWSPPEVISQPLRHPREIRFSDIDGDGRADQIIITPGGGAQARLNKSDGESGVTLGAIHEIVSDTQYPPEDIQFADINGDGKAEFLYIEKTGTVHIQAPKLNV
ncbi:FG-GAP-like repeat-containing protein [Streptomyces sp. NPDC002809]|uniref:FG-GAP-like repeat-containing protein n=1 Tax=Streptomyces sp. NPDC002809 TaxID=3154433 RepID=UPI003332660C